MGLAVSVTALLGLVMSSVFMSAKLKSSSYAGALQGTFQVSSSGAASYTIPISLPPGTHDMAPRLSINYTHSSGNGQLGMGFSMSGLAAIQRVGATVVQDGFVGSVNYDAQDRYSSNGTRLINTQGVYGADQTVYHTETESWKKVISNGSDCGSGPCWFKVITKKGYTLEFGNSEDSRVESTNGKGVRVWALNKATDLNGNYIVFTYKEDSENGSYYPLKIAYTGNSNTGLSPQRSVQFNYENRTDTVTSYLGGGLIKNTKRLDSISTYVGQQNVLNYRLDYQYSVSTNRSLLASVKECDNANKCLPPTTFSWQQDDTSLFESPQRSKNQITAGQLTPIDINGDGLIDIATVVKVGNEINPTQLNTFISNGITFSEPNSITFKNNSGGNFFSTDFNGDGLGDMMKVYLNEQLIVNTFLSNGTGLETSSLDYTSSLIGLGTFGTAFLTPADVNSDGRTDLIHAMITSFTDSSKVQVTNFLSTGDSFEAQPAQIIHFSDQTDADLSAMDVNGDGMSDLVYISKDNPTEPFKITPLFSNQGTSYKQGQTQSFPLFRGASGQLLASDVNGDGMSDVIYAYFNPESDGSLDLSIYFSQGEDFVAHNQSQSYPGQGWLMAMEVNGDNLTDLTYVNTSNTDKFEFVNYLSTGNNFQLGQTTTNNIAPGQNPMPLDINGDAKTDLLLSQTISGNIAKFKLTKIIASGPYPDLIDSLDNAIGGLITIDYKPLTDPSIYQMAISDPIGPYPVNSVLNKISGATHALGSSAEVIGSTTGATYPVVNVTLPTYAVASYALHDGRGSTYPYSYFYRDAKVDRNGRGWLGFQSQTMTDSSSQNITNTYYHQLFPLSGKTDSTTTFTFDNELMSKNSSTYQVMPNMLNNANKLYQINQIQSRTDVYDYGAFAYTLQKDYGYDDYGNATLITDWGDIANNKPLYTISTYQNDMVNWQIGYLTQILNASDVYGKDTLNQQTIDYETVTKNVANKHYWIATNQSIDSSYVYDDYGNMEQSIDQAGDTTSIVYDDTYHSFPVQHITPPNQWGKKLISNFDHEPYFGKIKRYTDPNGNSLQIIYDDMSRMKEVKGPNQEGTMVTLGRLDYIPDPQVGYSTLKSIRLDWEKETWQTTQSFYDGIIRNYKTFTRGQDNQLVIQQKEYNSENKVINRSFPYFKDSISQWVHISYDPYERIEKVVLPKGNLDNIVSRASYLGKSITVTHAVGTADQTQMSLTYDYYDSQRKYTQQVNANGELTQLHYDLLGRPKQVLDPQNIESLLSYDGISRRTQTQDASLGTIEYRYNDDQRIYQLINAKNDTISRTMDALGRMILKQGSREQSVHYQYDLEDYANAQGKLAKVLMDPDFYYTYTYDSYRNIDTTVLRLEGKSYTQVQKYKPNRSPAELIFPDGSDQKYQYTPQGLLESISLADTGNPGVGAQTYVNYQQYDARGDILDVLYGNKVSGSYSYTPLGKTAGYSLNNANGVRLIEKSYTWNDAMQIQTIEDLLDDAYTQNFTYMPSGRLLTAQGIYGSKSYQYDASGNMLLKDSINYTYDDYQVTNGTAQESLTDTIFQAHYNEVGNRVSKTVENEGQQLKYKYKYDVLNRLTRVEKEGNLLYTYRYDYTGRRVQKIDFRSNVISTYVSPNYEIATYVDSTVYTKNILGADGLIATISHSDNAMEKVNSVNGMPTTGVLYFHRDHISNTRLTTSMDGTQQSKLEYMPYGGIYKEASEGPDNFRYKFGSKELDEGADLYYFNARYYDPLTGRFITADTQLGGHPWQADVLNRYAYVLNNPIKNSDPSGNSVVADIVIGITVAVTVVAEVVVAVGTFGTAIPAEVAIDAGIVGTEVGVEAGIVGAEVGAEAAADVALDGTVDATVEGSAEGMGEGSVDSATESLTDCDCDKMNEEEESMCFVAGTKITTKEGSKNIEDVTVSDEVWTYNEDIGTNELHKVVEVYDRNAKKVVILTVNGEVIKTTEEHPFRVENRWVPAGHLKVGDMLMTLKGNTIKLESISYETGDFPVYNLEVENGHNYYVSAATILVHNMKCNKAKVKKTPDMGVIFSIMNMVEAPVVAPEAAVVAPEAAVVPQVSALDQAQGANAELNALLGQVQAEDQAAQEAEDFVDKVLNLDPD